VKLDMSIKPHL